VKHLNLAVHLGGKAMTRGVVASNRLMALWPTVIGKNVVMAVTGLVLIGFVIAHMLGNLQVFSGPNEINAYTRFLREVGWPELGYGQLPCLVWIVLFVCVTPRITAAIQLLARHEAAQPDDLQ
jgi:succinate dehydrogenase / fumarate reductase cytochrome b subunit